MAAEKTGKHAYRVMIENQAQKTHRVLDVVPHAGSLGQTIYIEAQKGDLYRLAELLGDEVGYAPESLKVARVGADLHITFADDTVADLVISRYYDVIPADSLGVVGQAFDGQVYSYLQWQQVYQGNVPTLADGMDPTLVGLGGNPISEPVGNAFAGLNVDPTIAAIGLLGLLGLAGGGGGGGSSGGGGSDAPTNKAVGLAIAISTDADNNALVSKAELGSKTEFTSHVTVNGTAQVGGKVVISAVNSNGSSLDDITRVLSADDIANGFDVSFEKPEEGQTQTVTANYVNAAGTAASDAGASDSAKRDTTAPGKNPDGSDGKNLKPIVNIAEAADGGINANEAADGIQTQVTLPTGTVAGDTVTLNVLDGNGNPALDAEDNAITVDYKVTADDVSTNVAAVTILEGILKDGNYQVSAVVTDQAGNSSEPSAITGFTLDTSGETNIDPNDPNATPQDDPNAGDSVTVSVTSISEDTGTAADDFITSDNTLVISGTTANFSTAGAANGDKVSVKITDASGEVVASALVDPDENGDWTFDATQTTLDDGVYTLNASIVDAAGNVVKAGGDETLVIDRARPNAPYDMNVTPNDQGGVDVNGMAEPGSTVVIVDPKGGTHSTTADDNGVFTIDNLPIYDGEYQATATDDAGNTSLPAIREVLNETNDALSASGQLGSGNGFDQQINAAGTNGAFSIDAEGNWSYIAKEAFNRLNVGVSVSDTFAVKAADGTQTSVTVTITGTNDAAEIGGTSIGEVTEDSSTTTATGTLTASDVDNTDNAFQAVNQAAASAEGYGSYTVTADGEWTYTLDNGNATVNALNDGASLTDTFVVKSEDGTQQTVTVTIKGANDAAKIAGTSIGEVTEDSSTTTATGTLTASDVDNTDNAFQAVNQAAASAEGYGSYTVTAGGAWTYTLDNGNATVNALNVDNTLTDTFVVQSDDGTEQTVTVTIKGTNDAAKIAGTSIGEVTEDSSTTTATGTLTASDVDNTDNAFQAVSQAAASAEGYGSYTVTAGGAWTYTLDNSNAAVNALNVDDTLTDTFVVKSEDGTEQTVTVTIHGTDDAPVIDLNGSESGVNHTIYSWNSTAATQIAPDATISDVDSGTAIESIQVIYKINEGGELQRPTDSNILTGNTTADVQGNLITTYTAQQDANVTNDDWTSFISKLNYLASGSDATTTLASASVHIKIFVSANNYTEATTSFTSTTNSTAPITLVLNQDSSTMQADDAALSFAPLATSAQMDLFSESPVADPVDSPASSDANTADALAQAVTDLATAAAEALGAGSAATLDAALASDIGSVDWNAVLTPEVVGQVDEALSALDQLDLSGFTLDPALSSLLDHWGSSADTAAVLASLAADDALRQLIDQQLSTVALGAVV